MSAGAGAGEAQPTKLALPLVNDNASAVEHAHHAHLLN